MPNIETLGGAHHEYEIGHDTIVKVTASKLEEIQNSDIPNKIRFEQQADLHANWDTIMGELEKAQGN